MRYVSCGRFAGVEAGRGFLWGVAGVEVGAGAGVLVARARAGRNRGEATLIVRFTGISPYTALLSPPPHPRLRRSSPARWGGGSSRDIPSKGASTGKAGPRCRPRSRPSPASCHAPYRGGYRPGRGSGREPPPRQREPCWPSHRAPAQERGFSWQGP